MCHDPACANNSIIWDEWFEIDHDARRRSCFAMNNARCVEDDNDHNDEYVDKLLPPHALIVMPP
jgi:hypothetical protein